MQEVKSPAPFCSKKCYRIPRRYPKAYINLYTIYWSLATWYGCNMSALVERSVRIREVEGSNPFRSTKNKPPARVDLFLPWAYGSRSLSPLAGEIPSGPPKISHPQGWLYFCCALPTRCLTVRPVALCPALWYTAHSYPHIAFIKEDCLCLLCWSAATGGST